MAATKDVDHLQMETRWKDKAHAIKRANFAAKSKRLFKIVEKVTWDVAARSVQAHCQFHSARG